MPEYQGGRREAVYASRVYYVDVASAYPSTRVQPVKSADEIKAELNAKHGKRS